MNPKAYRLEENEEEESDFPKLEIELETQDPEMDKTGDVFISDTNNRAFRIKTAVLYFCIHAILIFWTFYYLHDQHGKHENLKQWFRNYDYLGHGYDIAFTVVLLVSICLISFWQKLGRSGAGYGIAALILVCYTYLTGYTLRIACKARYDLDEEICKALIGIWCGGIGLLIAAVLPSAKFNKTIGLAISMPLYIMMLVLWRYVYKMDNPKYLITLLYIGGTGFYCWYINECMSIMVTKRQTKYKTGDYVVAFGNLQTDIFAMFWVDLICKKKKTPIVEELGIESEIRDHERALEEKA